jgi:hypothetical protein
MKQGRKGDTSLLKTQEINSKHLSVCQKNAQCKDKDDFKIYTKDQFKPTKYKHFSRGSKLGNTFF